MAVTKAVPGRKTCFAIDEYDATHVFHEYKFKRDADLIDITTFGSRITDYLSGIQKSNLEMKGFYYYGAGNIDGIIQPRFGADADVVLALCPNGYGVLSPAIMVPSTVVKYDLAAKLKDATAVDAEFAVRGYIDSGTILVSPNAPLATGTAVLGPDLDNGTAGGATTAGCSAQLHVFKTAGTTPSLAAKIEHSTDGTAWSTLITFSAATKAGVERITLPIGTTVKQHVRSSCDVTGTGASITALLTFARSIDYS